ncbi:MAG: hypothetical protein IJI38_12095 [Clostridia bacterium]|nr:hypothetical protein [Clostridia bacterium]
MDNEKIPLIHICGTVSEQDFSAAMHARGIRSFLKYTLIYLLAVLLIDLGSSLYYWYPYIQDGFISFSQWLSEAAKTVFSISSTTFLTIGFIVLFAILLIGVKPMRARKQFRELHPEGLPIVYDFFDDQLVIHSSSSSADETFRLKYADVRRKIKETRHMILLATGQKNRIGLYKTVMTPDQLESVRKLLNERCPQHMP